MQSLSRVDAKFRKKLLEERDGPFGTPAQGPVLELQVEPAVGG